MGKEVYKHEYDKLDLSLTRGWKAYTSFAFNDVMDYRSESLFASTPAICCYLLFLLNCSISDPDQVLTTIPVTVPATKKLDLPPPDNPPSNLTRGSNCKPRQTQLNLRDIEAEITTSGSSIIAQQAALLPPVNISNRTHMTRASTRARPPTDSPTATYIGDEPVAPSVIKPPPKKRKANNDPTNASDGPSKPPTKGKGKRPFPTPTLHRPPVRYTRSPLQLKTECRGSSPRWPRWNLLSATNM
jgi:hypothetical protein